jgi:RimJ/RimL family protein N-acetyltransferase
MSTGFNRARCEPAARRFTGKDGRRALVRPIRAADEAALLEAFEGLSAETIYRRFHSPIRKLSDAHVRRLASADQDRRVALVAEEDAPGRSALIAVARYEPTEIEGMAEAALLVGDCWQNNGLGRFLLQSLVSAGAARGVSRFRADVLADNAKMLALLAKQTEILERCDEAHIVRIVFRGKPESGRRSPAWGSEKAQGPGAVF